MWQCIQCDEKLSKKLHTCGRLHQDLIHGNRSDTTEQHMSLQGCSHYQLFSHACSHPISSALSAGDSQHMKGHCPWSHSSPLCRWMYWAAHIVSQSSPLLLSWFPWSDDKSSTMGQSQDRMGVHVTTQLLHQMLDKSGGRCLLFTLVSKDTDSHIKPHQCQTIRLAIQVVAEVYAVIYTEAPWYSDQWRLKLMLSETKVNISRNAVGLVLHTGFFFAFAQLSGFIDAWRKPNSRCGSGSMKVNAWGKWVSCSITCESNAGFSIKQLMKTHRWFFTMNGFTLAFLFFLLTLSVIDLFQNRRASSQGAFEKTQIYSALQDKQTGNRLCLQQFWKRHKMGNSTTSQNNPTSSPFHSFVFVCTAVLTNAGNWEQRKNFDSWWLTPWESTCARLEKGKGGWHTLRSVPQHDLRACRPLKWILSSQSWPAEEKHAFENRNSCKRTKMEEPQHGHTAKKAQISTSPGKQVWCFLLKTCKREQIRKHEEWVQGWVIWFDHALLSHMPFKTRFPSI